MEQREVTPRVPETIAIRYVSNGGDDADDGLSWGTAKHTIYGALISLPGGATNTAGSGTVYVGNASSASFRTNAGIWLMGPKDPNYANPPTGWLKCNNCSVNVIGIANSGGGPNGHKLRVMLTAGGGSDRNHPGIWLSAINQAVYIANFQIQYPGRAIVIGECSNNDRSGTCGSQSIILDNISALLSQTATNGPCTDVTSNSFWIWMRDGGCGGNAYNATGAPTSDNSAAILLDGSAGSGSGLIYITDYQLAGGGIKLKQGSNGQSVYVRNVIQEGDGAHALPPTVWFTSWGQSSDAILDNIQIADYNPAVQSMNNIQNDGITPGGPTVLNSQPVTGSATVINQTVQNTAPQVISPLRQRQSGFFDNYVVGQTDVARRIGGLVPSRFANQASSNTANWTFSSGSTFRQGLPDPFGGTGAAKIAWTNSVQQNLSMGPLIPYTPVAGDWIVAGVWSQGIAQNGDNFLIGCNGYPIPTLSSTFLNNGMIVGDGQWQYLWIASKVASGPATNICATVHYSNKTTPTLYGPTLFIIPVGTQSDNEVLEFANTMNSVDSACPIGADCNVTGHPLVVSSFGTLSNCSSAASPAKCDSAPAGSFVLEVGSTTARVNTRAVTANSQILIIEDSSLGAKLHVSCNKTIGRTYMITDRAPGFSFAVSSSFAPTDHPACLSFQVLN
jgi:hypothetical protein